MASKKRQSAHQNDIKQQDVLQAVVIADSFNVRFAPVTHRKPRVLLPLVNTPLLDYCLEFLSSAGIEKIFLFCKVHADEIKEHIKNSKWGPSGVVTPIVSEDCLSVGDALREMDSRSLITSDFVLVNGDLVSNMNLKKVIEEHKNRRQKIKSSVMTMVLSHAPPAHKSRCREEEVILALDRKEKQVLQYQRILSKKKFTFPIEIFQEHESVDVRYDLLDSHISVCSPLVPQLFTDNFDYQTRDDFVRGILVNEEILGNTIHAHVMEDAYGARVSNLQMYDAISKDVICRWTYPIVPDLCASSLSKYLYGRHNVYLTKDVTLARECKLEENVVVGCGSSIGTASVVTHSVIGQNCKIGQNVHISGSYIWDGVTIEDNCNIQTSLVCDNSTIKKGVTIEAGCVLSYEVTVGPDITLPSRTILLSPKDANEIEGCQSSEMAGPELIGSGGYGTVYSPAPDSDAESVTSVVNDMWGLSFMSEDEGESEEEESDEDDEDGDRSMSPELDDAQLFYQEVLDTLDRAVHENITSDNIVLEINSLKHAYNIQIKELNMLVVKAIVEYPQRDKTDQNAAQLVKDVLKFVVKMLPIFKNYVRNSDSQLDCLSGLEDFYIHHLDTLAVLMKILHQLYNVDILEEDVLHHWFNNTPDNEHRAEHAEIRDKVAPFIKWLDEAEEESDDSD